MNDKTEQIQNSNSDVISEMETCVMCDEITNESKDTHVDFRYNYIDGMGQLCVHCAKKYK